MPVKWMPAGDHGLVLEFGNTIQERTARHMYAVFAALKKDPRTRGWNIIPSYTTIVLTYPLTQEVIRRDGYYPAGAWPKIHHIGHPHLVDPHML